MGAQASPAMVSAPAHIAVALTLVSGDGKAHSALMRTTPSHTLHVPAHGRASLLLSGLAEGRYGIVLDHGAGAASLVIGVQPGP